MKIRSGFVSNSSSSSFIIISKNGKLTQEKLMKAIGVDKVEKDSVLYKLGMDLIGQLLHSSDETSAEDFKNNWVYDDSTDENFNQEYPDQYEIYNNVKINGWKIYEGSADSVDDAMLCDMDIYYEDDDIKIEKSGGY